MGRGTGAKESRADYRPCLVWVQLRRVELGAGYTSRVPLNGVEESEETKLYAYAAMLYDAMCQVTSFANQAWRLERSGLDSSRHVASCHSGIACTTLPTSPFIKRTPHQDQCLRSIPISHDQRESRQPVRTWRRPSANVGDGPPVHATPLRRVCAPGSRSVLRTS